MNRAPYRGARGGRGRGRGNRTPDRGGRRENDGQRYNNDGRQQRTNRAERTVRPLSYKLLEEISTLDPPEALHRLASYKKGFELLIKEREIRFDLMTQLTNVLANVSICKTSRETLYEIMVTLQAENFVTSHLVKYVRHWPLMIHRKTEYKDIIPGRLGMTLVIISCMLSKLPSQFDDVGVLLPCLDDAIQKCQTAGVVFPDEVCDKLVEFKDYHAAIEKQEYDRKVNAERGYRQEEQEVAPEDDFHDLPIFPIAEELKETHKPFLRKNIVNKGYDDVAHYLDIQFRLLREDFVAPLRAGISEYRRYLQKKEGKGHVRLQDVFVYNNVQVLEAKPTDDGIVYVTRFSVEHLSKVKWERSRRLLYGSLVCLSSDEFETVVFAVVVNRKPEELKNGLIELKFHQEAAVIPTMFTKTYTMAESSAYFEAYRHVLKRIQEVTEETFPLESYIVKADPRIELPYYLKRNQHQMYDLTPVALQQRAIKAMVALPYSWPPLRDFDLDPSQFEAFKSALTEELCLIQGPPGTGKTFIGLKIVETLLRNRTVWSPDGDTSPILLICYTNHALDQFLEGILEFLKEGVVRIGGRSVSEKVKELNLKELRRNRSKNKQRPKHQYIQVKNIRNEMIELVKRMQESQKSIRTANSKILKETKLKDVIPQQQFFSLQSGFDTEEAPNIKSGEYIAYWLGAIAGAPATGDLESDDDEEAILHADVAPPLVIQIDNRTGVRRRRRQRQNILDGLPLQEYITKNLQMMDEMSERDYLATNDVWELTLGNRWRMYRKWLSKHREHLQRLLRLAHRAILRENVLRPFISEAHWRSLGIGIRQQVHIDGQRLAVFLGVLGGEQGTVEDMTLRIGLLDLNAIENENAQLQMMWNCMRNDEEVCRMAISREMMIYVAKCLAHVRPMSRYDALQVRNVNLLTVHDRWRLYKYWTSLYCIQLQNCLTVCRENVLREDKLRAQMTEAQVESFNDDTRDDNIHNIDNGQLILLWLGAYSGVPLAVVQEVIDNLPQEDGDIDIIGEAELLNEERYLDDRNDEEINEALEDIAGANAYSDEDDDGVDIDGRRNGVTGGWQMAGRDKRKLKKYVNKNLRKVSRMPEARADRLRNVWELQMKHRWDLYRYWLHLYKARLQDLILPLQEEYEKQSRLLKEARMEEDVDIIKDATIIALTTSGAAKYHHLLQRVHPRIVVVEEAAEVLEAHIVTSLTEKCQHLILIGDHQQLRPNPTVYELAKNYHLDISLFERLIKNNFPKHRLNLQHRMRPEISQLLRIHEDFYPDLEDHDSVTKYDNIRGIESNVFFLDHTFVESTENDDRSRSNKFEAEFLAQLCRYLLQQGYFSEQITILTAYTGQLWNFKSVMPKSVFGDVRVCPIDRYQGEENDIILLSLVRSNDKGNIGFLKIANRVCVALSRAKQGLYCVGNFSLLSEQTTVWKKITELLRFKGHLGTRMTLRCENHPDITTVVKVCKDFKAVPEGGCTKPCETRLNCGHVCPMFCHPRDAEHSNVKCMKKCTKPICDLNHKCTRSCYQECVTECIQIVKKSLDCGHEKLIKCFQRTFIEIKCIEPCTKILGCGHPCKNKCNEGCTNFCQKQVIKTFKCGHIGKNACGNQEGNCPEPCGTMLKCEHKCLGKCGDCKRGRLHVPCDHPCGRTLVCGHECKSKCTEYCPPCTEKCQNRCIHSKCVRQCGKPCTPCQEQCEWRCRHEECSRPCFEPCKRRPCNDPCRRRLKCGHECIGICGETCPPKCGICDEEEVTEVLFGHEDEEGARFVLLEDCRHIIEVGALDTWMKETTDNSIQVKVCPKCKTPIRRNLRYSNSIKQARADVEHIKKQLIGDPILIREKRDELLQELPGEIETPRRDQTRQYGNLLALQQRLREQPPQPMPTSPFTSTVATKFVTNLRLQITRCYTDKHMESLSQKMEMYKRLCELKRKTKRIEDSKGNSERKVALDEIFEDILHWLDGLSYICIQNADDWNTEIKRVSLFIKLMEARLRVSVTVNPQAGKLIKNIHMLLCDGGRLSPESETLVKRLFAQLQNYSTGLGVTEEERAMIVKAVGLSGGHWYKCPKGHIYAIGECGGASQRGRCPECREDIGGANHQLAAGNRHAPEMDRSQHAAWSDAANMQNFDLQDII